MKEILFFLLCLLLTYILLATAGALAAILILKLFNL